MQTIISIIGILITILFVVGTHEYAHFITARLLGVKVLRFSIGFGKTLWSRFDKKGTEYVIALIPLGGYVKMLDEHEEYVQPHELQKAYNRQPFYKKFLIVLAGPAANLICAFMLYWLIFVIGFTTVRPLIGEVKPHSIAAQAGLQSQQEIISVDGQKTPTLMRVLFRILYHAGNQDTLTITTENSNKTITTHHLDLSNWEIDPLTPDPLGSLGFAPYQPDIPLVIGIIAKESVAANTLKIGDKLLAINKTPIKNWEQLITTLSQRPGETILLSIERQGKKMDIPLTLGVKRQLFFFKNGYLGIGPTIKLMPELLHKVQYDPITAIPFAWQEVCDLAYLNILMFGKIITGKLSLQSLGGPITIFQSAGSALRYGFIAFISFLAFLSVSIGIINLMPIPGLDGGHLFIQLYESIMQRTLSEQAIEFLYRIGLLLIVFVLVQVIINDILRLYW